MRRVNRWVLRIVGLSLLVLSTLFVAVAAGGEIDGPIRVISFLG